jgi:hypothetical protein
MTLKDAIYTYSNIFKKLQNRELDGNGHFCGFVDLCPEIVASLNILVEYKLCDTSVDLFQDDNLEASVGSVGVDTLSDKHFSFKCKVALTSQWEQGKYYIDSNWDTLLKSTDRILQPVKQAFFTDNNELTNDEDQRYKNYLKLSKICTFIDEVALPTHANNARTVIFERDIIIYYSLKKNDLDHDLSIESIERLLEKDSHHEAKFALMREALVKFLHSKGSNQRFGYLVSHFNAFSSDLLLSYQCYAEKYTFDKVRKEYQEKQTEYIQKVNDVYSDIGAKVLAIPAGLWLAVFKLEEATVGSFGFIKNIIILLLCILCMLYAIFHFSSQFSVLKSIASEYQSLFERLALDHKDESASIKDAIALINKSAEWTWLKLTLSNFATAIVFIMVIVLGYNSF